MCTSTLRSNIAFAACSDLIAHLDFTAQNSLHRILWDTLVRRLALIPLPGTWWVDSVLFSFQIGVVVVLVAAHTANRLPIYSS